MSRRIRTMGDYGRASATRQLQAFAGLGAEAVVEREVTADDVMDLGRRTALRAAVTLANQRVLEGVNKLLGGSMWADTPTINRRTFFAQLQDQVDHMQQATGLAKEIATAGTITSEGVSRPALVKDGVLVLKIASSIVTSVNDLIEYGARFSALGVAKSVLTGILEALNAALQKLNEAITKLTTGVLKVIGAAGDVLDDLGDVGSWTVPIILGLLLLPMLLRTGSAASRGGSAAAYESAANELDSLRSRGAAAASGVARFARARVGI